MKETWLDNPCSPSFPSPPIIKLRYKTIFLAPYGSDDASGDGFGSAIHFPQKGLSYRIGVWKADVTISESSNWHEFTNCVEALEEEAEKGTLASTEVFFFTDNSTVERCFYNGTTTSVILQHRKLCERQTTERPLPPNVIPLKERLTIFPTIFLPNFLATSPHTRPFLIHKATINLIFHKTTKKPCAEP